MGRGFVGSSSNKPGSQSRGAGGSGGELIAHALRRFPVFPYPTQSRPTPCCRPVAARACCTCLLRVLLHAKHTHIQPINTLAHYLVYVHAPVSLSGTTPLCAPTSYATYCRVAVPSVEAASASAVAALVVAPVVPATLAPAPAAVVVAAGAAGPSLSRWVVPSS